MSATDHRLLNTDYGTRTTGHAAGFYLLSLTCFALGLMCKPVLVTFPFVLLLLDYWPLGRRKNAECRMQNAESRPPLHTRSPFFILHSSFFILDKLPFFVLAAGSSFITIQAHRGLAILNWAPWDMRIQTALVSYGRYLGKVFWPSRLAVFYPYPAAWPIWEVLTCALLLLVISGLVVRAARNHPSGLVGWLWFLGVLVPFSGLVQAGAQAMADRFMYVPVIGIFVAVTWGLGEKEEGRRKNVEGRSRGKGASTAAVLAGGAAVLLCCAMTRHQLGYWRNSETLFSHALDVTENNYLAHKAIGDILDLKGRTDAAISQYREAIRLKPDYALARNNLGNALDKMGQSDEAFSQFQEALRLDPGEAATHYNLGNILARRGQIAEAISHYQEAIRLKPDQADARYNLGSALAQNNQLTEAISEYQEALRLRPDYPEVRNNLGIALARAGQIAEAVSQFQEALRLKPDYAEAGENLGNALVRQRQIEVIRQRQEIVQLKPEQAGAHYDLGNALAGSSQLDEAIAEYQEALRLKADYAEAHYQLANALAKKGQVEEAISQYQEAVRLRPDFFQPHLALALILPRVGQIKDAASQMEEFLSHCPPATLVTPDSPLREAALRALNDLAWLMATRPQAEERDGARAVRFAERACELTQYQRTIMVGTLAAAYAEAGRFAEAATTAEKATALAKQAGDQALLARNLQLLELYRAGRAYHEPASPGGEGTVRPDH